MMRQRKDVLIARLTFALLIVLIIGIIVSVVSRISANRKNQKQIAEVVEETQETEKVEVDNTEFLSMETEATEVVTEVYVKTTAQVNFRKDPTTDGEVIATIEAGTELLLESEADGWSEVTYNDETGYVNSNFVEKVIDETTTDAEEGEGIKARTTTGINFRSGPGTDYEQIASIAVNAEVTILSEENGWAKIEFNGQTGYVNADYLMKE